MNTINIKTSLNCVLTPTDRAGVLMRLFGLNINRLKHRYTNLNCTLTLHPGEICFITGSSGAGKSALLDALYNHVADCQRIRLSDIPLEKDVCVIDCMDGSVQDAIRSLNKAGLSDVFSMLTQPGQLSTGQQWRYRLAKAIHSDRQWIFADEFTASLDRITACVIAHKLRKTANHTNKRFVLASCHEDILLDLRPNVIVRRQLNGKTTVTYREDMKTPVR